MIFKLAATSLLFAAVLPLAAHADLPGQHPGYLHAQSDLRDARANLERRPGDAAISSQEDVTIEEIDQALGDVKNAAREDDKNLRDHPHEDARMDHPGRLHHALDLLRKAYDDLANEEDIRKCAASSAVPWTTSTAPWRLPSTQYTMSSKAVNALRRQVHKPDASSFGTG